MNFLAHAYLSFGNAETLVGNMIADLVKGRQIDVYPLNIQQGIHIHRKIDAFTDSHPVTLKTMEIFRPSVAKYAGAFLDVAYDHFLALSEVYEPEGGWESFTQRCYLQISEYGEILPSKFCTMFMYMKNEDWLYNYRNEWLIEKSFFRLKQRAVYLDDNAPAFESFKLHYEELRESFESFFPELYNYVKSISEEPILP